MRNQMFWTIPLPIAIALTECFMVGTQASPAASGVDRPHIEVLGEWGNGPRENVQRVLGSAAEQLLQFCPDVHWAHSSSATTRCAMTPV